MSSPDFGFSPGSPGRAPGGETGASELPRGKGELILLADDEEPIRVMTRRMLTGAGYQVILAEHGAEALRLYSERSSEIALILSDLAMPGMDGRTMIAEMARLHPAVKVVAMTGYIPPDDESCDPLPAQVIGLLEKPFTMAGLLQQIRNAIDS